MIIQLATFFKSQITIRWDLNDKGSVVFSLSLNEQTAQIIQVLALLGMGTVRVKCEILNSFENVAQ